MYTGFTLYGCNLLQSRGAVREDNERDVGSGKGEDEVEGPELSWVGASFPNPHKVCHGTTLPELDQESCPPTVRLMNIGAVRVAYVGVWMLLKERGCPVAAMPNKAMR